MNWRQAGLCGLLLLSCAPRPSTTDNPQLQEREQTVFGDAIDDAAWEALGARNVDAPALPFGGPVRLEEFWFLDHESRSARMDFAQNLKRTATDAKTQRDIDRLDLYLDAIRMAPLYFPAWAQASRLLFNRSELSRVYALAQQYARLAPPGDGVPYYLLGKCEARMGKPRLALELFEKAIARPAIVKTDVVTAMALVHLQLGNLHAAESLQAIYDVGDPALNGLIRARRARQEGNLGLAVTLLEEIAEIPEASMGIWEEIASIYLELDVLDAALTAYLKALEETPDRSAPHIGVATIHKRRGNFAAAEKILQEVLERFPDNLVAHFNLAAVLLDRARASDPTTQTTMSDLTRAAQLWSVCIHKEFSTRAALWGRAETELRRRNLSDAQFDAEHLMEIGATIAADQARWAELLIFTGYETTALEALRQASRHHELNRRGRALLAQLEDKSGSEVLPLLQEAFEDNPHDAAVGMRLGVALMKNGELEEAEKVLRAVVELRPEDANAYQNLAAVLDRLKKYREAQAAMSKAESLR